MTTNNTTPSRGTRYLADILLGVLPLLLGVQFLGWITFFPGALRGHSDFRQLYTAGYMVRTGHASELYDYRSQQTFQNTLVGNDERALPFIRPAYQALLFLPFSLMSYRSAYIAFLAANLILLAMTFSLLRPEVKNLSKIWQWLPLFVFLVFYPVALALMQGQDSILLLSLLTAALVSLGQGREVTAGIVIGLGLFKMQIVIPIALLFLLWKRWRFVAGFALSAGLVSLVSVWVVGLTQILVYAHSLVSMGAGLAVDQFKFPLRVSFMANLRGLIFGLAGTRLPAFWTQALTIFVSAVLLLWVAASTSRMIRAADALVIAITASVIVSYYLFIHDLSVLLIPIVITLDRFINAETTGDTLNRAVAWTSAGSLVAPMCLFLIPDHFYLVSLPLCAFMFILTRSLGRELEPAASDDRSAEPIHRR